MAQSSAPFTVATVHFAFPGNRTAIPIRDPETQAWFGQVPEWSWSGSRQPAAFVGGTRPRVRVTFRRTPGAPDPSGVWTILGRGHHGPGLGEQRVKLKFGRNGLSQAVEFRLAGPLPTGCGQLRRHWHWHATGAGRRRALGITRHLFYYTRRPPLAATSWAVTSELVGAPDRSRNRPWVYLPVLKWTCAWAASHTTDKSVCDAILENLRHSRLQYAAAAWDVGAMLRTGGGYCGGWYRMFQAMAAAQGVKVERRSYLVDWRDEHEGVMRWCAIVVTEPGLNRRRPAENASTFHDSNEGPRRNQPVQRFLVRRYRFWGHPGRVADGHCINFLRYRGAWYLYDASFRTRAVALRGFELPRPSARHSVPVEHQGNFQRAYLNHGVGHLLGSLRHAGKLYRTVHPEFGVPGTKGTTTTNGLSVKTAIIPPRWRNITFYWLT